MCYIRTVSYTHLDVYKRQGYIDFFDRLVPALGGQIEAVHRVDLVPPELQTGGLLHVGRVDVHNVAAARKLARSVHLIASGIARAVQQGGQLAPGQRVAGVQGAGVGAEDVYKRQVNRLTTMAAAAPTANQTETRAVVAASTAIKATMAASQSIVSNHIKNAPFCRIIL